MPDWHDIPNASDHLKWYQNKGTLKLNFFLSVIFVGMLLNGYDGSLIAGLQASDAWQEDLNYPRGVRLGMLNAVGNIAGFVVGPVIAYIDEHWGRRWGIRFYGYTILIGSVIGCIAGVSNVDGYALFCTGRAIIGLGLASFLMTSLIVVQEIAHPRNRETVAASWNSYYILGSVIAAWVVFGCTGYMTNSWSWRIPYIIQVPMALYILIAVQFVPETPRFLLSQGREEEAFAFLVEYHGNGDRKDPLVLFEFEEMKEAIEQEKIAKAEKWGTILKTPSNRHRLGLAVLMIFLTNLSGSSIIYFYYTTVFDLVGITKSSVQTGINAGLTIFTWFCQIGAVYTGRFVGRRKIILWVWPTLLLGLIGLCVSSGVFANSTEGNTKAGVATVVMVWIYLGCFNFSNPILYSYPAEVQTFSMRSKGLLVWNTVSQLEGAYVTWVDAIALDSIGYKYYVVYMPLVIIQWFLVYFYMVETKGYTLEEIALAFGSKENLSTINILPVVEQEQDAEDVETKRRSTENKS
ncbi:sugar transporter [Cryptococcus neoformans]|uniref:Sugar transporter n=1 Tax=Cryptococcus neoformans Tu259-1 TaxID=1230072 RepID=A0A854QAD6_CRYNE|nr:sugar transporter [Cryptococcus neoformans var. grubii AD1-83a]OWZ52995.1 sugar transporter [Cryptococcus neoformans var. grubii 125.91]OXG17703.1 sugar transporter [Cryptococcus neoformans var. grubii Tu259-1]OXG30008.1 sugar transporter [Cryptococcus neoformans var. grubii Bt15]OXG39191.1 sugar transporter [Cryptococcus neoformans var. grubii Bt120]OXG48250.1 sugar transporter [Cryptococcus neoformans var. grubii Th84]OXG55714.1 sugar transporter [Cryptococcus neoformans var. grubii MW-R